MERGPAGFDLLILYIAVFLSVIQATTLMKSHKNKKLPRQGFGPTIANIGDNQQLIIDIKPGPGTELDVATSKPNVLVVNIMPGPGTELDIRKKPLEYADGFKKLRNNHGVLENCRTPAFFSEGRNSTFTNLNAKVPESVELTFDKRSDLKTQHREDCIGRTPNATALKNTAGLPPRLYKAKFKLQAAHLGSFQRSTIPLLQADGQFEHVVILPPAVRSATNRSARTDPQSNGPNKTGTALEDWMCWLSPSGCIKT